MRKWKRLFEHPKHESIQAGDEIGLEDILQLIILNSRFLGLTTIVLFAIAISLLFLQPKQYQKQQRIQRIQQIVAQLKQQIVQSPASNKEKLQALETQQAESIAAIIAVQIDKSYLQQNHQRNIANFTASVMSVKILSESGVQLIRSPKQQGVIAAIIPDKVARWNDEPS